MMREKENCAVVEVKHSLYTQPKGIQLKRCGLRRTFYFNNLHKFTFKSQE